MTEQKTINQFDKWAATYDTGLWSRYFRISYATATSMISKNVSRALDVGCGTGELSFSILDKVNSMVGIDLAPKMIDIANSKKKWHSISDERLKFVVASVDRLPFEDDYFDVVFCLNSFHHYPDQKKALREMYRVLKKGGTMVLLDPFLDNFLRRLWCLLLNVLHKESDVVYHTKKEMSNLVQNYFQSIHQKTLLYFTLFTVGKK